ncbi:MAG: rRNA maturation RNase YbeY [Trueperaceae bacterium]|nr:rRNA maturation RNase YbeY [Trueperaceae bacterium]
MASVEVLDTLRRFRGVRRLSAALETLMGELGLSGRTVSVVLVDDAFIAERNLTDRGVPGATDVLSYPTSDPSDVGFPVVEHLGDVIISLDTALRQARGVGVPVAHEVVALAAHGLVHLTGLDHHDDAEWRPFLAAQARAVELFVGAAAVGSAGPRPMTVAS